MALGLAACVDGPVTITSGDVDGSGTILSEDRDIADFDSINLAGEGRVIVIQGQPASLTIEADDNLLAHIDTTVSGGVLAITTEPGIDINPTDSIIYRITGTNINQLSLTGAGSFEMSDVDVNSLSLVLSGAGDIDIGNVVADDLSVEIAGAGDITVAGAVDSQEVNIPGAGSYEARDLESAQADVRTSGVGSATVWVTDQLAATVSGVGSIEYYGSPVVTEVVSGVGSINHHAG